MPQMHCIGGKESDGVVWSLKIARSDAGLYLGRTFGKSVEGAIGKCGSAGYLSVHSITWWRAPRLVSPSAAHYPGFRSVLVSGVLLLTSPCLVGGG